MSDNGVISVAVVHEQPLVIGVLSGVIANHPQLRFVGDAPDRAGGLALVRAKRPAVTCVAADIHQAGERLPTDWDTTRVVLLAGCAKPWVIKAGLLRGAIAVVTKDDDAARVAQTILEAAGGAERARDTPEGGLSGVMLSTREIRTLALASKGLGAKQIARELDVSVTTVSTFKQRARDKLGAATTAQAVAEALRLGFID